MLSRRVGTIYLVAGAELQGLTLQLTSGFLPTTQWSTVRAQIRRPNGDLVEKTMVLQSEDTTQATYTAELDASDLPVSEIARLEYELVRAADSRVLVLPTQGYVEVRVRSQV